MGTGVESGGGRGGGVGIVVVKMVLESKHVATSMRWAIWMAAWKDTGP